MKNNCIVFTLGLMMLSAQSFASRPAQIEGQPGSVPVYTSASVEDEELRDLLQLDQEKLLKDSLKTALKRIKQEAQNGSLKYAGAFKYFLSVIKKDDHSSYIIHPQNVEHKILIEHGLLELERCSNQNFYQARVPKYLHAVAQKVLSDPQNTK